MSIELTKAEDSSHRYYIYIQGGRWADRQEGYVGKLEGDIKTGIWSFVVNGSISIPAKETSLSKEELLEIIKELEELNQSIVSCKLCKGPCLWGD